jgi:hypothetical protein
MRKIHFLKADIDEMGKKLDERTKPVVVEKNNRLV